MIRQFELVERVKAYDPNADEVGINGAYVFAMKAHGSQKRASGDPYFSHPIEVAGILTDFNLTRLNSFFSKFSLKMGKFFTNLIFVLFKPIKSSFLPAVAASVRTLVVS